MPMPFNTLLLTCLLPGTHFTESGNAVSIQRQLQEIILFFSIDDQSNATCALRQSLSLTSRICDLLVFRASFSDRRVESITLCLVELKGRDVDGALEQIENIYDVFSHRLRSLSRPQCGINWKAYIKVRVGSPINYNKRTISKLKQKGLRVRVRREKDIGDFLRQE
jgi:hypothetical protein